jgi:hypothetical protein
MQCAGTEFSFENCSYWGVLTFMVVRGEGYLSPVVKVYLHTFFFVKMDDYVSRIIWNFFPVMIKVIAVYCLTTFQLISLVKLGFLRKTLLHAVSKLVRHTRLHVLQRKARSLDLWT